MRGYQVLRRQNGLGRITDLVDDLTNTRLTAVDARASALLFGAGVDRAEQIVRQYLLIRLGQVTLNQALLSATGRPGAAVVHPLPPAWRAVIESHGFKVARFRSALVWHGYVAVLFGYGVVSIGKLMVASVRAMSRRALPDRGRYAYFEKLVAGNLPQPGLDGRSHDIVTWYAQWPGREADLDTICHSVQGIAPGVVYGLRVIEVPSAVPPLAAPGPLGRYVAWAIAAAALAAFDVVRGRWWHALLLSEASMAAAVRAQDPRRLAREYLFHNAVYLYRPLWTYDAEQGGSRITLYCYSSNFETFKRPEGYPTQASSWQAMSWPRYLVWDEQQAEFFRRAVGAAADIRVVGPIWFSTSAVEMPALPRSAVAVFDVQPHRAARYQALGLAEEYFVPATANRFLIDVHDAVRRRGGTVVFKRKRDIGRQVHPLYASALDRLGASGNFVAIDPAISAVRVVEHCALVISMPFTATALLGRAAGKPSIYYDPHGFTQKDDRANHGIPVVIGRAELEAWLATHLAPSPATPRVAAR